MTTSTSINLLYTYAERNRYGELLDLLNSKKIISLCLFFSVAVHASFLVKFNGFDSSPRLNTPISRSIDIVLSKYIPEQPPEPQEVVKPVKPKKVIQPKPKPVEKKIVQPVKPEPVVEEAEEIVEEPPVEEERVEQVVESQPYNPPVNTALLAIEKEQYLNTIAAHLEKYKFYPRSARRRHIEGDVKVSFDLLEDGNILNLKIFSGHSALQKATSASITSALPMPPRPESLLALNTIKIEYSMQFSLHD